MVEWIAGLSCEVKFVGAYLIFCAIFIAWMLWMCERAPEHNEWE